VDVVRVLPYVAGQQRIRIVLDWRVRVMGSDNFQRAILIANQPCPTRSEVARRQLAELLLEGPEVTERFLDRVGYRSFSVAPGLGRHALPIEAVIEVLAGLIEQRAR